MAYISSGEDFRPLGSHAEDSFGCCGTCQCARQKGGRVTLAEWYERDDEPEPSNSPAPPIRNRGSSEVGGLPPPPTSTGSRGWNRRFALPPLRIKVASGGRGETRLRMAIASGNRDETQLTDMVFNERHPERSGRAIASSEPGYRNLAGEWLNIRNFIVRPALRSASPAPATASGTAPMTTVRPDIVPVRGIEVARRIAPQIEALLTAAAAAGIKLSGGGYRSREEQIRLRRSHCGNTQYEIYEKPADQCVPPTAPPGKSNHERGLAIDFTYNGRLIKSPDNPGFRWLAQNAATFGLKNLPSEPWHWSVDGR